MQLASAPMAIEQSDFMESNLCRVLEWDSQHFGMRLARVETNRLDDRQIQRIFEWCAQNAVRGLYYLCPANERDSARSATRAGFDIVDIRVEMERRLESPAVLGCPLEGRPARNEDWLSLKALAAKSHHDTRFYADPHFPRAACDRLYEIWLEKSCHRTDGMVWTADGPDRMPVGYVTCELESRDVGRIGLVAVREGLRGQGWGKRLMTCALRWFAEAGCSRVRVATQGANEIALRLYGGCGFVPTQISLWFHKWFPETT